MLAAVVLSLVRPLIFVSTLAMNDIAEVRMKRQWTIRRQFQPTTDAERRWDQTYQHLLGWTLPSNPVYVPVPSSRPPAEPEARDEDCDLWTGVNQPSDPSADD
jgi:hypothetical protein